MPAVKRLLGATTALIGLALVVAGLPWLLIAGFGWPGPDQVPGLDEVLAAATQPLSDTTVMNLIAIAGWAVWGWFMISLAVALSDALRSSSGTGIRAAAHNPARWLIAICLTAIAANLTHPAAAHPAAAPAVATVSASHDVPAPRGAPAASTPKPEVHIVHNGDTLWDIADQRLPNPENWPSIYKVNKNKPQPGNQSLTDPDLIRPGWRLDIPTSSADGEPPPKTTPQPGATPTPDPSPTGPQKPPSTDPAPHATAPPSSSNAQGKPVTPEHASPAPSTSHTGVWLAAGTLVSLAAIAGLLAAVRRARKRATGHTTTTRQPSPAVALRGELAAMETIVNTDIGSDLTAPATIGVGPDGTDIPAHTLTSGGLGVTGPGAHAVARALCAAWLSTGTTTAATHGHVVTTTATLAALGAARNVDVDRIARLVCAESTSSAIATLMREITTRTRILETATDTRDKARILTDAGQPPILTILTPETGEAASLRALLHHGARLGITGIILGDWPDNTITVNADGTPASHHAPDSHIQQFYIATPECLTDSLTTLADIDSTTNDPVTGIDTIHQPRPPAAPQPPATDAPARPTPRPVHTTRTPPASDDTARRTEATSPPIEPTSPATRDHHSPRSAPTATNAPDPDRHNHKTESAAPQQHLFRLLNDAPDGLTRIDLIEALYPTTPMVEARHELHQLIADTNKARPSPAITYRHGRYFHSTT